MQHKNRGFSLLAAHEFGNGYMLTSVAGWRDDLIEKTQDIDALPYDGYHVQNRDNSQKIFTQELRIISSERESFDFFAGIYYLNQDSELEMNATIGGWWFGAALDGVGVRAVNEVEVESYAAFIHGNIHLTDSITLFGGARYTAETKEQILAENFVLSSDGLPSNT
ncbi:MAG: iron complex outermembrane receptor protein [Oceanicoccus sp.]